MIFDDLEERLASEGLFNCFSGLFLIFYDCSSLNGFKDWTAYFSLS